VEVVLIERVGLSDLGNTTGVDGPSSISSIDWPSTSHTCCTEVSGKVRWAKRGFACHPEHRLPSVHSFPLSYCLQPGGGTI